MAVKEPLNARIVEFCLSVLCTGFADERFAYAPDFLWADELLVGRTLWIGATSDSSVVSRSRSRFVVYP